MQSFSLSRRRILLGALLLAVVLVLGARLLVRTGAPAERPTAAVRLRSAPVSKPRVVVHVVGAVRSPGLYRLAEGRRVADAVARAGGATGRADLAGLNLAAPLADGQQVVVPRRAPHAGAASSPAPAPASPTGPVQLSTATVDQLDTLPGIGPVTAQKIIDFRTRHGPFRSAEELDAVPGIGPARIEQLRELVVP